MMLRLRNIRLGFYIEVAEVVVDAVDAIAVDVVDNFDIVVAVAKNITVRLNHKFLFHFP